MGEVIGDVVIPSELIVPSKDSGFLGDAGCLFLSGAKLYFNPTKSGAAELITSA